MTRWTKAKLPGQYFKRPWLVIVFIAFLLPATNSLALDSGGATTIKLHENGLLSIRADSIPLQRLLADLAEKTGFVVHAGQDLTEPVSCAHRNIDLDSLLRRLLNGKSYSIIYSQGRNQLIVPQKLVIFGTRRPNPLYKPESSAEETTAKPAIPNMDRQYISRALKEADWVSTRRSDKPVHDNERGTLALKLGTVSQGHLLQAMQLAAGDTIYGINGRSVQSTADLYQALQEAVADQNTETTLIQIDRKSSGGDAEPIYLELR